MTTSSTSTRRKILSVTMADCDLQTFSVGGAGGQRRDHCNTGVRIVHRASGARGEGRESRSQAQNKKAAWRRMAEDPKFQLWLRIALGKEMVRESEHQLRDHDVKTEVRRDGQWVQVSGRELV